MWRVANRRDLVRDGVRRVTAGLHLHQRAHHGVLLAGGGASDPNFAQVKILMHQDGSNGATSTTDVKGHTVTRLGTSTVLSTTQTKFGPTSSSVPGGSTHGWDVAIGTDLDFGTGNFTYEGWAYLPTASVGSQSDYAIMSKSDSSQVSVSIQVRNALSVRATVWNNSGGFAMFATSASSLFTVDTWHHVALVRNGTAFALYLDGTSIATATSSDTLRVSTDTFKVGSNGGSGTTNMNGFVDEVRVTGMARYTANFTPPAAAFPDS